MNYKESRIILERVKKAQRILLNCHRSPDPDSIGSATAMYQSLVKFGKAVKIVTPSEFPRESKFIPFSEVVETVDFKNFKFENFDLCIFMDSSSWEMVSGRKDIPFPIIPFCVIDHHTTNFGWGTINIVDKKRSSTAEIVYSILEDWRASIDRSTADSLMAGIVGDTGAFRFPGVGVETFRIAVKLMELGADKSKAVFNIYHMTPFNLIKFYGEALTKAKLDKKHKFVWSAVPYEIYSKLSKPESAREHTSSLFAQIVEKTEFGIMMVEQKKGELSLSFRSRTGFDTSVISLALGGGGHVYASGAKVVGLPFDKAVKKVLGVARKYARDYIKNQKS